MFGSIRDDSVYYPPVVSGAACPVCNFRYRFCRCLRRTAGYGNDVAGVLAAAVPATGVVLGVGGAAGALLGDADLIVRIAALAVVLAGYGALVLFMLRKGTWGLGLS